jgi:chemotaxis protein methyltransferase CheR
MPTWNSPGMARVAELVRERTGLVFPGARVAEVESTVRRVMSRHHIAGMDQLTDILDDDAEVRDELVAALTIGETYFRRDTAQFELLRHRVLPELLASAGAGRPLRIWSAGCASGEEPYSIAMILDELGALDRASITGTDISRPRLADAQRGVYSKWSLRGVAGDVRRRYFAERGRYFELAARIRKPVDFRYLNLAEDRFPSLSIDIWGMDLILCRNVLIYFDRPTVVRVARRLVESLSEDGWLILGASDPAISEMIECDVVVTDAGLAYRRPGAASDEDVRRSGSVRSARRPPAWPPAPPAWPPAPPLDAAAGPWVALEPDEVALQRGADAVDTPHTADATDAAELADIADVAETEDIAETEDVADAADTAGTLDAVRQVNGPDHAPAVRETGTLAGASAAGDPVTEQVLAAYARRDFDAVRRLAEAAARHGALPGAAWLPWLRALANQGCHEAAAAVAERAMEACGPTAELLYLRAVLLLQSGDAAAAAALARRALYLDRELVVAHMTLAEAQRRLGNDEGSRRSLRNAAALLQALPGDALVPGSDGEHAGRLAELVRVKLQLLSAERVRRQA